MNTEKRSTVTRVIITIIIAAMIASMTLPMIGCSNKEEPPIETAVQTEQEDTESTNIVVMIYVVIFKDHDGKVLKTDAVSEGQSATAPDNPTRENYIFEGWDQPFDNVQANLIVTATYKAVTTYTVTFKDHDGKVIKTVAVVEGQSANAPVTPSRDGFIFKGWDTSFNNVTSDLVITAIYEAVQPVITTYTVTFKDHDGKVLKTETVEKGKAATAPANPTRTNYSFEGWDKSFNNVTSDLVVTAKYKAITTYTVTFKDYDGKILKTEKVEKGKSAVAPSSPFRDNFTFAGWDKSFNNVTSNLTVTATYVTKQIIISAESVTVSKGTSEVTLNIRVYNNPGIMGAILDVSVNDRVFSFSSASNTQYSSLTLTYPGPGVISSPYTFMLDAMQVPNEDKKDGILFSVTFKIEDLNATGTYDVKLSYNNQAIFDENYRYLNIVLEDGAITIK